MSPARIISAVDADAQAQQLIYDASLSHRHAPQGPRHAADATTGSYVKITPQDSVKITHRVTAAYPITSAAGRTQCCAHSKRTHLRCGARAIPGGTVCQWHGGAAPQVIASARERLRALAPVAVQTLDTLMARPEYPTTQLGAARTVIEYAEGRPTEHIEVTATRPDLSRLSEADLAALATLLQRAMPAVNEKSKENGE